MPSSLPYIIKKGRTLFLYAVAGGIAGLLELEVLHLITTHTALWYVYASALSSALSCVLGFVLRKVYVFNDRDMKTLGRQFISYLGVLVLIILISTTTMSFIVEHFGVPYVWAQALAGLVSGSIGFFINKQFTFHEPKRGWRHFFAAIKRLF